MCFNNEDEIFYRALHWLQIANPRKKKRGRKNVPHSYPGFVCEG
jgi:hypothetical protein